MYTKKLKVQRIYVYKTTLYIAGSIQIKRYIDDIYICMTYLKRIQHIQN